MPHIWVFLCACRKTGKRTRGPCAISAIARIAEPISLNGGIILFACIITRRPGPCQYSATLARFARPTCAAAFVHGNFGGKVRSAGRVSPTASIAARASEMPVASFSFVHVGAGREKASGENFPSDLCCSLRVHGWPQRASACSQIPGQRFSWDFRIRIRSALSISEVITAGTPSLWITLRVLSGSLRRRISGRSSSSEACAPA